MRREHLKRIADKEQIAFDDAVRIEDRDAGIEAVGEEQEGALVLHRTAAVGGQDAGGGRRAVRIFSGPRMVPPFTPASTIPSRNKSYAYIEAGWYGSRVIGAGLHERRGITTIGIAMVLLVTSASGANGGGYGKLLAFGEDGELLGSFSEDARIVDPRGLGVDRAMLFLNSGLNRILALDGKGRVVRESGAIAGLDPGGGNFGPDGRYHVGLRAARTIMAFAPTLDGPGEPVLPSAVVPFPRGFAFGQDGTLFLASGIGPGSEGDNTILAFSPERRIKSSWKVEDPELSPLDLAIAPNGNVVVSSEHPFGAPDAVTTIREYDRTDGRR